MISAALSLAFKDLRMYFRDRMGLVSSLLVPIAMVTVFGWIMAYAFGGGGGMPKVTLWVADSDQSPTSRALIAALRDSEMLKVLPKAADKPLDRQALEQKVIDGEAHHALIIPPGYGASAGSPDGDGSTDLVMLRDPGRSMEDRIIQFALMQSLMADRGAGLWKRSLHRMFEEQGVSPFFLSKFDTAFGDTESIIRDAFKEVSDKNAADTPQPEKKPQTDPTAKETDSKATEPRDPMKFMEKIVPVKNVDHQPPARPKQVTFQQAQSVSGVTVMMLMFSLTGAGALLLVERERGTLKRLLAMPIGRESILLGKFFYIAMVGTLQMAVLMVYGEAMFKVGLFRDPLTLLVLVVTWVACAGSFGMVIAAWSTSSKQGDSIATILILVMAALGGCWFPVQMMSLPTALEIASKSTLTYWAMDGFQNMLWNGRAWYEGGMLRSIGIQWIWTAILSTAAVIGFRRNYLR